VDDEAGGEDGVLDRYGSDPQFAHPRLALLGQGAKAQHGIFGIRDGGEVGPHDVVEDVSAQAVEHRSEAARGDPAVRSQHG
jgi:hypothetical protein